VGEINSPTLEKTRVEALLIGSRFFLGLTLLLSCGESYSLSFIELGVFVEGLLIENSSFSEKAAATFIIQQSLSLVYSYSYMCYSNLQKILILQRK
jgi:hypothetical protein